MKFNLSSSYLKTKHKIIIFYLTGDWGLGDWGLKNFLR